MTTYSMIDVGQYPNTVKPDMPTQRYAWLEHEGDSWHFLTNLFADPCKSRRRWSDENCALQELENEGWVVVYPYNEPIRGDRKSSERACGYGLMWIDQRMVSSF